MRIEIHLGKQKNNNHTHRTQLKHWQLTVEYSKKLFKGRGYIHADVYSG